MEYARNELLIDIALGGVAVYFTVQSLRILWLLLRYRRLRSSALLTWPMPPPPFRALFLGLGLVSATLALIDLAQHARFHHTFSQAIMALYFLAGPRLLRSMRLAFYEQGIWCPRRFLRYERIGRWAFRESSEIVLILVPRGGNRGLRLRVPAEDYGAARKLLQQKTRDHAIHADQGILGLSS